MKCKKTMWNSIVANSLFSHFVKQDMSDTEYVMLLQVCACIDSGVKLNNWLLVSVLSIIINNDNRLSCHYFTMTNFCREHVFYTLPLLFLYVYVSSRNLANQLLCRNFILAFDFMTQYIHIVDRIILHLSPHDYWKALSNMSIRYANVLTPARWGHLRLIPGRYKTFFSAPKHPDRLRSSPRLLFEG